jgi:hypothetical protein
MKRILFDRSQTPQLAAEQLAEALGVVKTTMGTPTRTATL